MSTTPLWVATPKSPIVSIATANANRDGSGTIADLYTAPATGGRVDDICIKASVTTTTGMIRFFRKVSGTYHLIHEVAVTAATPSATVQAFQSVLTDLNWIFENGHILGVSTEKAETFKVAVTRGGDF